MLNVAIFRVNVKNGRIQEAYPQRAPFVVTLRFLTRDSHYFPYSQCRFHRKARFAWLWYISRAVHKRAHEALSGPVDHRGVERVVPSNSLPHH